LSAYLWIALGSAIGGMARYYCSGAVARRIGEEFPWGTLFVNVIGSFIIGFFATLTGFDGRLIDPTTRLFVTAGFCGGYTTFSSFSLQTLNLARDGQWSEVAANIIISVLSCLAAVFIGHLAALAVNSVEGA
jgi:CrcB protein